MSRRAALSKEQVKELRAVAPVNTLKVLAARYEVSLMTVWKAVNKQRPYDYETEASEPIEAFPVDTEVLDNGRAEPV